MPYSPVRKKSKKNFKECQICKKVFPNNSKLRRHEKVHVKKAVKVLEADSEVEVKKRKSNKSKLVEDSSFESSNFEDEATDRFELNNDDIEMANDKDSSPPGSPYTVLNLTGISHKKTLFQHFDRSFIQKFEFLVFQKRKTIVQKKP